MGVAWWPGQSGGKSAIEQAGLFSRIAFSWVAPLIQKGWKGPLSDTDADFLVPTEEDAPSLAAKFDRTYEQVKAKPVAGLLKLNATTRTLLQLYAPTLVLHSFWVVVEIAIRVLSPLALRQFLRWLLDDAAGVAGPVWQGWVFGLCVAAGGVGMTIVHHQFFWVGMKMGFDMRMQVVAAIHAKVLRLNSASVAHVNAGHIVNLASNDVRRFDDAIPFWIFTWAGPLELAIVLVMVSLELGVVPAVCGVAATLSVMPMQALLVRYIGGLRRNGAARTDERVRLTGEVIQGALAMKMLGWEEPFAAAIRAIRKQEVSFAGRMAQIRGLNLALQYCMAPVTAFVTFSVYKSLGGVLNVSSVFYALALLNLPRLYMVYFFVLGVQYLTELKVSLFRIDKFLASPEPPPPVHLQPDGEALPEGGVQLNGCDFDWASNGAVGQHAHEGELQFKEQKQQQQHLQQQHARHADDKQEPPTPNAQAPQQPHRVTLAGVKLEVHPGELLGICGEVGSGKSSVLAALLGELQPVPDAADAHDGAPRLHGSVAYCSQVPWVMAATLRDNITFGSPWDPDLYAAVLSACALNPDIAELPAGDATELGERGINLSGGQKARVALARAAYAKRAVQLLDDPLSAVDPRVGATLFDKCIGPRGLMADTTRILVTHQRQYLPQCDRVAVLRRGELVALGTYQEVAEQQLPELLAGGAGVSLDQAASSDLEQDSSSSSSDSSSNNGSPGSASTGGHTAGDAHGRKNAAMASADGTSPSAPQSTSYGTVEAAAPAPGLNVHDPQRHTQQADSQAAASSHSSSNTPSSANGTSSGINAIAVVIPEQPLVQALPPPSTPPRKQLQWQEPAPSTTQNGSTTNNISSMEDKDPGPMLTRDRTMPPDVNYRPPSFAVRGQEGPAGLRQRSAVYLKRLGSGVSSIGRWGASFIGGDRREKGGMDSDKPVAAEAPSKGALVKSEDRATGTVSWRVYARYCQKAGAIVSILLGFALVSGQGVYLASEWWLAQWAYSSPGVQGQARWLWVYGLLVGLVIVVSLARASMFFEVTLQASTRIHDAMVGTMLRAPLSFFHTNPAGRVLNRFSNDLGRVDDQLPMALFDVLQTGFMCLGAFVLVSIAVPYILPVFVPLVILFYYYRQRYVKTSRDVKRIEAITRSPVYASFSATLKGLPTIRAYDAQPRFHAMFLRFMSANGSWWYAFISTARWVGFRLDTIATTTLVAGVVLAMAMRGKVSPAIVGLALSHVLQLTGMLQWCVRQSAEVENTMTSVERMLQYTTLEQEPPRVCDGAPAPPKGWPSSGRLEYHSVTASYRPGLPAVLKDLTFTIPAGCSCGVVGRTGSGKSSLMLTLFRLIDINDGVVLLDGVDTASIGLDALRRQLAIIPQDPVLFSGTLRSNLDPWNRHDDAALWDTLARVQLKAAVSAAGGLDTRMAECGDNLSVGQRQLFCLGRALLQDAKVLALDEATANVDRGTDALIQKALRDFALDKDSGRVLMVIAHRIDTIMDCDKLLVLSNGVLVEDGPPTKLTARPGGVFAGMVEAAQAAAARSSAGGAV